ncbi:A-kinase anchor protein 12b isoform X2 [Kryptolebias marmoratus]|uniref:A kinase (PRKA) anchor protein 12b n=1 Tax=Kryptolebias marmoratus TaxID=37003 RepID=A0A3Q3A9T1_KRYMA|nr:A-kinase anchor protein 12b isoform X2 [Kryptolebias marmoratus]
MLGTITLTVGQPDGVTVAQKEEAPDATETVQVEGAPQVNGEKMEKESPEAIEISPVEEKVTEEKPDNANEVGFKKIFSIVGLKFTLKKDKSDEADPVKLLIVKDKEAEEVIEAEEPAKDKEAEEKATAEEKTADTEAEAADAQPAEAANEEVKEEGAEKETETTSPTKETGMSSFRKLFSGGLFSNLRKKTSIKKTKEEEEKEAAVKEEAAKAEGAAAEEKEEKDAAEQETTSDATEKETQEEKAATDEETKEENVVTEQEAKEEKSETQAEEKPESKPKEEAPSTQTEAKSDPTPEEKDDASAATESTTETKQEDQKEEEKVPAEATAEAEPQPSQEKSKPHGSPLKKLFTGAGLKKLSTKRQKNKKESESKPTESGEQVVEQLQSSNESEEAPKADSGTSSPEASGEHAVSAEGNQNESGQETEGELSSDGEKKKDGVIASFRKLVSPKKYAKRSSDSEDEGANDKMAKSATLSSSESAPLAEKAAEEKETKEDNAAEEEPMTENTEKLTSSTEEPKKKMDTSVSWEALMCMGGPKKRTRKTSDSDDEETKAEEEPAGAAAAEGKEEDKTEDAEVPSQSPENEEVILPAPEPVRESPWSTLKRLVMPKTKAKSEEKPEEPADQVQADAETQKEESSFSLRKLFHGRRKKVDKQSSTDQGSGEEDSDTPAVVPLSEYEEPAEAGQEAPAEPAAVQAKASADDRSPSWIPAVVEDDKHDQLSDIPEEVENSATPKSVDTDIADDEAEDQAALPKGPSSTGRRLSTAEVKPVTPAPAAATSPVPQGPRTQTAGELVSGIEAQVSEIPAQISVALQDAPLDVASADTEPEQETESAACVTKAILEPHVQSKAVAICTGLEAKETEDAPLEQLAEPTVESVGPLSDAAGVEVAVEQKSEESEAAAATEEPVLKAQVHQVQTLELEPVAEQIADQVADVQAASESYEAEIEKVGAVSTENSVVIQPAVLELNSPQSVVVDPIAPATETAVCTQTVEVSEMTVETKEGNVDTERCSADGENTPAEEVTQALAQEGSAAVCDTKDDTKEPEAAVPAETPGEENAVITDTSVLVAPGDGEANKETIQEEKTEKVDVEDREIETQSAVIAEAVIKDAIDKVLEDVPQPEKSTAAVPTPVKATVTTEGETDSAAEPVVITETPVPVICEKPASKSPQLLRVAMEITENVPLEVTQDIQEKEDEEEEPKGSLKMAEEVQVSEGSVMEEEVTEIKAETDGETEPQKEESKESGEAVKSQLEGNKSEEKSEKVHEVHMPTQVVLQSAEEAEEPPVEVETAEELDKDGSNAGAASEETRRRNKLSDLQEEAQEEASGEAAAPSQDTQEAAPEPEKTPAATCAEVMAQVMEVIEEAVKEIEPVSTEITAAS